MEVLVLRESEIRELLDAQSCIAAVERAFADYSSGRAELPAVIHLGVPERGGEVHIKAGHLHHGPHFAVKIVAGFPGKVNGMVLAFDAQTGSPAGLLFDNGAITDLRTGAAGAVAAKHLAPAKIRNVAVIGTGVQARLQVAMLALVREFEGVRIWGRDAAKARAVVQELGTQFPAARISGAQSVREAVADADVIFTVTASRQPIVQASWLKRCATVIAIGSDGADKQELATDVLARADRIVADSIPQCLRIGELHHAIDAGVITRERILGELGEVVSGAKRGRESADELIVCDLTGVGVQDVAAASLVMERARARGAGQRLTP